MRPALCLRICGSTAWVTRRTPKTLVSNSAWASSMAVSSVAPSSVVPALLTSTSMRPASAITCSMLWRIEGFVTNIQVNQLDTGDGLRSGRVAHAAEHAATASGELFGRRATDA